MHPRYLRPSSPQSSVSILDSSTSSSDDVYTDDDEEQPPRQQSQHPASLVRDRIRDFEGRQQANRQIPAIYDLTNVNDKDHVHGPRSYSIDPFESYNYDNDLEKEAVMKRLTQSNGYMVPPSPNSRTPGKGQNDTSTLVDEADYIDHPVIPKRSTHNFIDPDDIHPNMESQIDEVQRLRLLAGKLSAGWGQADFMAPALARRIRDFQFAQEKRRKKYGDERPWGILGVYDHLASIRIDVDWAEDAAQRRANGEPYQSWADFDESRKGGSNRPYFTYFLLFVCTIIMIASIGVNNWTIEPLDENPMMGPSAETLLLMGAKDSYRIVMHHEGWRLLTNSVLHAGLVHYLVNMLALWFVGAAIEMSHGWLAAMIIFLLSAVGGSILSALFLPEAISVGASGGIFGFIGACLADIIMHWRLLFCDFVSVKGKNKYGHVLVVLVLVLDICLNSIIGLTPYIDNYNHLGGMIYGFLCGLSAMERLSVGFFGMDEGWMVQAKQFVVRFFGILVSVACIVTTFIVLLQSDATTKPCPSCTWLSCVPFPPWESNDNKWWYCDDCGRVTAEFGDTLPLHLEMQCPKGGTATIELEGDADDVDRNQVQKDLPDYCREYCPLTEEDVQSTSVPN